MCPTSRSSRTTCSLKSRRRCISTTRVSRLIRSLMQALSKVQLEFLTTSPMWSRLSIVRRSLRPTILQFQNSCALKDPSLSTNIVHIRVNRHSQQSVVSTRWPCRDSRMKLAISRRHVRPKRTNSTRLSTIWTVWNFWSNKIDRSRIGSTASTFVSRLPRNN